MDKAVANGYKRQKKIFACRFIDSLISFLVVCSFIWLIVSFSIGKLGEISSIYNLIILGVMSIIKFMKSKLNLVYLLGFFMMWVIEFINIHMAFWTHIEYYGVFIAASTNLMFHGHLDLVHNDIHGYITIILQIIIWIVCAIYSGKFHDKPPLEIFYTIVSILIYRLIWFKYRQDRERLEFKNRIELKIKESNINSLLQVIPEGIIVMDLKLQTKMTNPAFQFLFPENEINNLEFVKLHHHYLYRHNQFLYQDIQQFIRSDTEKIIFGVTQALGNKLECTASKAIWNNEQALVLTFRDVTNLIKMEREGYKNLNTLKTLRGVSHELKTSINVIINNIATVLDNDQGLTIETQKNLQVSYNTCQFLLCSIRDILDYSNLKNNNFYLVKSAMNLKDLVTQSISIAKSLFRTETLNVHVNIDVPTIISSDKSRLQQVLLSLISTSLQ